MGDGRRRVVVTGLGVICPLGNTATETWANLMAGRSGVAPITRFDPAGYATTFAAEVRDFDPGALLGRKEARRMDRFVQFAVAASRQAVESAGLAIEGAKADRVGVLMGTGMGGMETFEQGTETVLSQGPKRLGPFFVPMMLPNMAAGNVAIALGAKGPNFATISACASSAHAIGEAAQMIRRSQVDVMLAGGSEAPITRLGVAGFNAMGALSTRNDTPTEASRPFDADRDGFVLGEGGAVLVLEALECARARGATVLAEVSGYGTTDDANHIVQPAAGGEGAARAMRLALADAGIGPADVDYVNAHGTSTQLNEKVETEAIKAGLGEHAWRVPISGTKSMTGHLLGAAGSLEAAICIQALGEQCVPPTINYRRRDPDCDLDYVPNEARPARLRHVLSNSMGFGGHNVALVLSLME